MNVYCNQENCDSNRDGQCIYHKLLRRHIMQVNFKMEKATKNTIRFTEVLENELDAPKIGTLYVPKQTLGTIGWADGKNLVIEIKAE